LLVPTIGVLLRLIAPMPGIWTSAVAGKAAPVRTTYAICVLSGLFNHSEID